MRIDFIFRDISQSKPSEELQIRVKIYLTHQQAVRHIDGLFGEKAVSLAPVAILLVATLCRCGPIKCKVNCAAVLVQLPCGPEQVVNGSF